MIQGANRQISERRPPNRGNSACITSLASAKRSPTNSPTNFVHETSRGTRAHLRFRCDQHLGCRPSLRLMVRTYIRKGGHGGDCSRQACLPATGRRRVAAPQQPQQWLQQRRKTCLRKRQQRRRRPTAGNNGPSTEMSSIRLAINCKQCNHARLVSLADSTLQMKTQRVLVDGSRVLRSAV